LKQIYWSKSNLKLHTRDGKLNFSPTSSKNIEDLTSENETSGTTTPEQTSDEEEKNFKILSINDEEEEEFIEDYSDEEFKPKEAPKTIEKRFTTLNELLKKTEIYSQFLDKQINENSSNKLTNVTKKLLKKPFSLPKKKLKLHQENLLLLMKILKKNEKSS
jgi:hypothetical protein